MAKYTSKLHEARTYKLDGIDLTRIFCFNLGIEKRYSPESAVIFLRLGEDVAQTHHPFRYVIYMTHGLGGGVKESSKINKVVELANIIDADIYIHSHTHLPLIFKESYYRLAHHRDAIMLVPKLFVNTSSSLNYGGYGELASFKPNCKETPHIFISGVKKEFTAKL